MADENKRNPIKARCGWTVRCEVASEVKRIKAQVKRDESLLNKFLLVDGGILKKEHENR